MPSCVCLCDRVLGMQYECCKGYHKNKYKTWSCLSSALELFGAPSHTSEHSLAPPVYIQLISTQIRGVCSTTPPRRRRTHIAVRTPIPVCWHMCGVWTCMAAPHGIPPSWHPPKSYPGDGSMVGLLALSLLLITGCICTSARPAASGAAWGASGAARLSVLRLAVRSGEFHTPASRRSTLDIMDLCPARGGCTTGCGPAPREEASDTVRSTTPRVGCAARYELGGPMVIVGPLCDKGGG